MKRLGVPRRLRAMLALATVTLAPAAHAQRLLVNTNDAGRYVYGGLHYGGSQWSALTAVIDRAFTSVATVATMTDLTQMLQYDALWVDQRWQATAAPVEISNMLAFAATGRRVVVMGENATWGGWNSQVLTALGGMEGPLGGWESSYSYGVNGGAGCMNGRVMGLANNPLVTGVNGISLACGGYAIGGTQLFAYNVATLWRPEQNVLTILDANIMDDLFARYEAPLFRDHIVTWLAASHATNVSPASAPIGEPRVASLSAPEFGDAIELASFDGPVSALATPEPSAVVLLAAGLGAVATARRRRRRA